MREVRLDYCDRFGCVKSINIRTGGVGDATEIETEFGGAGFDGVGEVRCYSHDFIWSSPALLE